MNVGHSGKTALLFGLCATIIYLVMVLGTLKHLTDLAGVLPFDLRPAGYSQVDAVALLDALGESGRQYYLMRQIPLDMLYPALLALTLISTLRWCAFRCEPTLFTRIGGPLAVLAATFDYLENLGIGLMLVAGPAPNLVLVQMASAASILKAVLTSAAILAVIAALVSVLFRRWSTPRSLPRPR